MRFTVHNQHFVYINRLVAAVLFVIIFVRGYNFIIQAAEVFILFFMVNMPDALIPTEINIGSGRVRIHHFIGEREFYISEITGISYSCFSPEEKRPMESLISEFRAKVVIEVCSGGKVFKVKLNDRAVGRRRKGLPGYILFVLGDHVPLTDEEIPLYQAYLYIKEAAEL